MILVLSNIGPWDAKSIGVVGVIDSTVVDPASYVRDELDDADVNVEAIKLLNSDDIDEITDSEDITIYCDLDVEHAVQAVDEDGNVYTYLFCDLDKQ